MKASRSWRPIASVLIALVATVVCSTTWAMRCSYTDDNGHIKTFDDAELACKAKLKDQNPPEDYKSSVLNGEDVHCTAKTVPEHSPFELRQSGITCERSTGPPTETAAPREAVGRHSILFPSESLADYILVEGSLTLMANRVKGLGQQGGATVEIALAKLSGDRRILVAGLNSSAKKLNAEQLDLLRQWQVNIAPNSGSGMTLKEGGAPHAEQNIAAYLQSVRARGERWSRAVVGAVKPSGNSSYVCDACKEMIKMAGGRVEEFPSATTPTVPSITAPRPGSKK